jgi:hypothetical protein
VLDGLRRLWPGLTFTPVLTRGGWYRLGGVVDLDKRRVADSLHTWAEAQAADGDLQALADCCLQQQLFATRLLGRTRYLTAPTGAGPADFVQIEVEELQEVLDRYLSDPDWLPDSLEEFIDPLDYPTVEPEPVGAPRLVFRRMLVASEFVDTEARGDPLVRFLRDWEASSAQGRGHFCDHWALALRETADSDGEPQAGARPVSAHKPEPLSPASGQGGADLANLIHQYDHAVGYPMAWYFHMVARAGVSHAVAARVYEDHQRSFSYLPERDLALLRGWVTSPYRA